MIFPEIAVPVQIVGIIAQAEFIADPCESLGNFSFGEFLKAAVLISIQKNPGTPAVESVVNQWAFLLYSAINRW